MDNKCIFCKKTFSSKSQEEHDKQIASLEKIISEKDKIISEKDNHIKELEGKLENIALKAISYNYMDEDPRIIEIYQDEIPTSDLQSEIIKQDQDDDEDDDEDGYINVSNLCKAGGKQFPSWNRLEKTKGFLKALSSSMQIHMDELIKYKSGSNSQRATWVHPQVAINIAQWISPEFDVKVSGWVYEIMVTGKVDIKNTKTYRQLQRENKN
jgi:hypothetical protein